MELVFELVISLFGELFLQLIAQFLVELGFQGLAETVVKRKDRNPYLAFIGYCLFGLILGAFSLYLIPELFIKNSDLALLNLFVTPVLLGLAMNLLGKWRIKKGQELIKLDTFLYGFAFSFCIAIVRYSYGDI